MPKLLQLELDRRAKTPLAAQIRSGISNAIETGVLASGARLPSWQDLAAQLGVARGTVRSAYEKLCSARSIVAALILSKPARTSAAGRRWPCRSIASTRTGMSGFSRLPQIRSDASHTRSAPPGSPRHTVADRGAVPIDR
jgi:DNA-binding transcriptional MocR family regulator